MPSTEVIAAISAVLTLSALGFSIFASIYSNLLHTAEMADGNALQGNEISKPYWCKASNRLRNQVKLRAYSANCCFYSLISIIVCLAIIIACTETPHWWLIPFGISIVFLIIALTVPYSESCKRFGKWLSKLRCWPITPEPKRLTEDCKE